MVGGKIVGLAAIFKDSIKEVLGDTIGFSNREENKKLSSASMELMFFIFSEFASLEKDLILESNFHKSELEKLHKIAEDMVMMCLQLLFLEMWLCCMKDI